MALSSQRGADTHSMRIRMRRVHGRKTPMRRRTLDTAIEEKEALGAVGFVRVVRR
jgi:hypothetical protein